jgi:hypothetical protein
MFKKNLTTLLVEHNNLVFSIYDVLNNKNKISYEKSNQVGYGWLNVR